MATISSNFFTGEIALHVQVTAKLPYYALHILTTDALSLFIRAGNYWWVSHRMGEEDGFMRAEVGEEHKRLPPFKGWQFSTTSGWFSEDYALECSRHPSAESAGPFVC